MRRPQISDGSGAAIFDVVGELEGLFIDEAHGFGCDVRKSAAGSVHDDAGGIGFDDLPDAVGPFAKVGKVDGGTGIGLGLGLGLGLLGIETLRDVGEAIVHPAGVVLEPVALEGNGAPGSAGRNQHVAAGARVTDLADLTADFGQDGYEQS